MNRELSVHPGTGATPGIGRKYFKIPKLGTDRIVGMDPGSPCRSNQQKPWQIELSRLRRAVHPHAESQILTAETETIHERMIRQFFQMEEDPRRFNRHDHLAVGQAQPIPGNLDLQRSINLRNNDADTGILRNNRRVVRYQARTRRIDAHERTGTGGIPLIQCSPDMFAGSGPLGRRNAIFEIEDDGINIECPGLLDHVLAMARNKEKYERWGVQRRYIPGGSRSRTIVSLPHFGHVVRRSKPRV